MAPPALANWRRALLSRLTIGIGSLFALGLTTARTIIDAMPTSSPPVIAAGQPIETGRWRVTLQDAVLSAGKRPDGYRGTPGTRALAVDVDLLNRTSESSNVITRTLTLDPPVPGQSTLPTPYLMRDNALLGALQPGLPERVRLVWEVPENAQVPEALRLVVTGETFKPRDNLFAAPGWFDPKAVAAVSLPVTRDDGAAP